MRARLVRTVVLAVCALGVAGMIAASVADANEVALTFGLISVSAIVSLIVATAVANEGGGVDEERAQRVEALISDLVAAGADEGAVRTLVGEAARLRDRGDQRDRGERRA